MFELSLSRARQILECDKATRSHVSFLDNRLETFRSYLNQELEGLIEDAVEVAFLRCVPEIIGKISKLENEECSECGEYPCECDDSHEFDSYGHCESCDEYWWEHHDLQECLQEDQESNCTLHQDHAGTECNWTDDCDIHESHEGTECTWNCDVHKDHYLRDCDNSCIKSHSHDEWHEYMGDDESATERHNSLYPDCEYEPATF